MKSVKQFLIFNDTILCNEVVKGLIIDYEADEKKSDLEINMSLSITKTKESGKS